MLPLESVSRSWQPPEPIVPFKESLPILPVEVIGRSVVILPNEVRAETL